MKMKFLDKAIDALTNVTLLIGGILLLITCFNVTYGVIMRYIFHNPSIQAIELTKILLIPALVLAVAFVQWTDRHLKVDFISMRFPKTMQRFMYDILVPIMGLYIVSILVWKGWDSAIYSLQISEKSMSVWSEPLYPVRFTIPIGYGLLGLVMVVQLFKGICSFIVHGKNKEQTENLEAPSEKD